MTSFRDPGRAFVARRGVLHSPAELTEYVSFLRTESGVGDAPPVDLAKIRAFLGMPAPRMVPLDGQQGVLLSREKGLLLIKEDDPLTRQRFTLAHELMEFLFAAFEDEVSEQAAFGHWWRRDDKERHCERGAAELLLPESTFCSRVESMGVSIATASSLAEEFQTSLLATMRKMVEVGPGLHAMAVWQVGEDPEQMKRANAGQGALFADFDLSMGDDLRIKWFAWSRKKPSDLYLSRSSTPPQASVIRRVFADGGMAVAEEAFSFKKGVCPCVIEVKRITIGRDSSIVSLLHIPGDDGCPVWGATMPH